jgi:DNA gyrase inhibitor GyrI
MSTYNLTETPETTHWEDAHYVYVERVGPFSETARECWMELHSKYLPELKASDKFGLKYHFALYKTEPECIYRAGVSLNDNPMGRDLPDGARYELVPGGKYATFTLTGSYSNLPKACGRVFEIVKETNLDVRKDAFYVEHYVNNPSDTPEDQLITNIMVPIN